MDFADACRKARFRSGRRYLQDKLWRWLRRRGERGASVREIVAADLGIASTKGATNMLTRMRRKGCVVCAGRTHQSRWRAIGAVAPAPTNGLAPASLANLRTDKWLERLMMANIARGCPGNNATLSRRLRGRVVVSSAREDAPKEIVGVPTLADLAASLTEAR